METDEYLFIVDYLNSGVEFVEGSTGVKGHLKQCISYWESTISAPRFVLDVISEGYELPFIRVPDTCYIRNNRSKEKHPNFVEEAISSINISISISTSISINSISIIISISRYQKLVIYFGEPMCRLHCTAVTGPCRYFAYVAAFLLAFAA